MEKFLIVLTNLERTYWSVAVVGSAILLIIFILTFTGGGDAPMWCQT